MLRNSNLLPTVFAIFAIFCTAASAEEKFLSGKISDEFVAYAVETTNAMLPKGRLRDGSHPDPLTRDEQRYGVIPMAASRRIVNLAADTALTEHCGLDWKRLSFLPLMRRERNRGTWSDRQITYIGILHGFMQRNYRELLKSHQNCSTGHKRAVAEFFSAKRW